MKPSVSSLYQSVELLQEPKPLLIGERCNANGSKRFRDRLLEDDYEGCLKIAMEQQDAGAHVIDVCTAYAGRDEKQDLTTLVRMFADSIRLPLVIDSTTPDCIEATLRMYPGRCIVNSINLEDGGDTLNRVCPVIRRYGAAVIALTIGKAGMAMTAADKIATAKQIHDLAVEKHGLRPTDLIFDPLTFTIGSGDETLRDAAIQTLEAIRGIKAALPGVLTVLGLSNISFGLPPHARKILNSVFLHEAIEAGLDAAIVDAAKVIPLTMIGEADREMSLDLLYDRQKGELSPLMAFINHFNDAADADEAAEVKTEEGPAEQALTDKLVRGEKEGVDDLLSILMRRYRPGNIINTILVPAMRHVGVLFGKGEMLLPFVLQSAEVMKRSVAYLEPFMDKADTEQGLKVLLATVQGDVHDIGKNLVDIILSNNGYQVFNIGIKCPTEMIIAKAKEYDVDVVGLSGLLVKSAIVMQESMPQYLEKELGVPILLGGAALTQKFVAQSCVPAYNHPVVYCPDAFAGLKAVRDFEEGKLDATTFTEQPERPRNTATVAEADIARDAPVPDPPFFGTQHVTDIDIEKVFPYVNDQALFRGRWGYRRGKMSAEEYETLILGTVAPQYEEFKRRAIEENLVQPKVAYGYYRCYSEGNTLNVEHEGTTHAFTFPRREEDPRLCIADFYKTKAEGGDVAGFFVVTIGETIGEVSRGLFEGDSYHDYLLLHGFSVELTDALAEYWHEVMRKELGIAEQTPDSLTGYAVQDYQGSRYGFGYPACPDLDAHTPVFAMLKPEAIGVTLTENMEMVPEQTTSAIIAHHPQAKYFAV
ncbi:MAG: dihydropteroate synthase [Verrucomicrobia bacterium]|nr:dihydropteroate synthase [Verrucomicrobiota bacterium]